MRYDIHIHGATSVGIERDQRDLKTDRMFLSPLCIKTATLCCGIYAIWIRSSFTWITRLGQHGGQQIVSFYLPGTIQSMNILASTEKICRNILQETSWVPTKVHVHCPRSPCVQAPGIWTISYWRQNMFLSKITRERRSFLFLTLLVFTR